MVCSFLGQIIKNFKFQSLHKGGWTNIAQRFHVQFTECFSKEFIQSCFNTTVQGSSQEAGKAKIQGKSYILIFTFLQMKIISLAQLIFYWISHCIVRDRIRLITAYYLEVFTEISWTRFILAPFNLNLGWFR